MDKVCTGCGRFESDGPIGNTFLSCCPDSDYQEIGCNMKDLIVFYKSQAKELEGLRELIENIKVIQTHQLEDFPSSYECLKTMCKSDELLMDEYSDGYVEVEELRELLKDTTQPDKGGE